MTDFDSRHKRWLRCLEANHLDGFLVTHPPNLFYLFNFQGSAGLAFCVQGESYLIVDSRYLEAAQSQAVNCQILLAGKSLEDTLQDMLLQRSSQSLRLGFESNHLSYDTSYRIQSWEATFTWIASVNCIEELRAIKDQDEIGRLEKAFEIAQTAWSRLREQISVGMRELEVAGRLEFEIRRAGGESFAFETLVAAGPRSSRPHASPGPNQIQAGEKFLLVDFGVRYQGYCSDLTRIYLLPRTSPPSIYEVVREAQEKALSLIRPGVSSVEVDLAAREVIAKRGYGDHFGHGTGHGLGLEVHELPSISPRRETEIQENMVFTIEPGIYLPDRYGIRIEDTVLVTDRGYRLLSQPQGYPLAID